MNLDELLLGAAVVGIAVAAVSGSDTAATAAAPTAAPTVLKPQDAAHLLRLEPEVRGVFEQLVLRAYALEPKAVIVSGRRTKAEQDALYEQGRSTPGPIVTNVRGCRSWHVLGRAVDLWGLSVPQLRELGVWWASIGGVWGGDFRSFFDGPHYEFHPGLVLDDLCAP